MDGGREWGKGLEKERGLRIRAAWREESDLQEKNSIISQNTLDGVSKLPKEKKMIGLHSGV